MKYKCNICGHIYDEKNNVLFDELPLSYHCPICKFPKSSFKALVEENKLPNAIKIHPDNVAITRIEFRCINCGICTSTCNIREGMMFDEHSELCVNCGQCIQTCPVKALIPKPDYPCFLKAKSSGKKCIAYTSPAIRVAFGELFGKPAGSFEQKKMVGLLKLLGFDYVFDTTFAADLTIMEEANELLYRLQTKNNLPMFTSCCPAWVKYAEQFYPEIIPNLSTCKSPIGMMGAIVQTYFTKQNNIQSSDIYNVAITPCTAKKYEINRPEIGGTNLVITLNELVDVVAEKNINYEDIPEAEFDTFFPEGSGGGVIFGNTGGVMESALRTVYFFATGEELPQITFQPVRGYEHVKEATLTIGNTFIKVCVIHQMNAAKPIIEAVKNGTSPYHFIEIMNCEGGCVGGGGQPKTDMTIDDQIKQSRIAGLYQRDASLSIKAAHNNPHIIEIYKNFLEQPGSKIAHELLHTNYHSHNKKYY